METLQTKVKKLNNRFKYAIEARDKSWFNNNIYDFLKDNKITLGWSIIDQLKRVKNILKNPKINYVCLL
jgi:uncharacterized protein YecE (DUF72 family)